MPTLVPGDIGEKAARSYGLRLHNSDISLGGIPVAMFD
jgi:hypothetical protein